MTTTLRIGTRGSDLARMQVEEVAPLLEGAGFRLETVLVRTAGDAAQNARFSEFSPGIFTKALDEALLAGRVDCAVHSAKDLPTELPPKIRICAFSKRTYPEDALVLSEPRPEEPAPASRRVLPALPEGARLATSSPRRKALLLNLRPDLKISPLRGSLGTRLAKVSSQGLAGTVLARAGLSRLNLSSRITEVLDPRSFIPAPGQGSLAVTVLEGSYLASEIPELIEDKATSCAVSAERSFLKELRGGCRVPAGAYAEAGANKIKLYAVILSLDGSTCLRAFSEGALSEWAELGSKTARELIAKGAGDLLKQIRGGNRP